MTIKKPSLEEFAKAKQPPPCRICTLPEGEEVNQALRAGIARRIVVQWLHEVRGYATSGPLGVSGNAMEKHATNRHHFKEVAKS